MYSWIGLFMMTLTDVSSNWAGHEQSLIMLMTFAQVVKTSVIYLFYCLFNVITNIPSQDNTLTDGHTSSTYDMIPGFKTFAVVVSFVTFYITVKAHSWNDWLLFRWICKPRFQHQYSNNTNITNIFLSSLLDDNPLVCDCRITPNVWSAEVTGTCASPPHLRGIKISTLYPDSFGCRKLLLSHKMYKTISVLLLSFPYSLMVNLHFLKTPFQTFSQKITSQKGARFTGIASGRGCCLWCIYLISNKFIWADMRKGKLNWMTYSLKCQLGCSVFWSIDFIFLPAAVTSTTPHHQTQTHAHPFIYLSFTILCRCILLSANSCADLFEHGRRTDGLYTIRTSSSLVTQVPSEMRYSRVWCDMKVPRGGWMVFQQRINVSVNFSRDWISYEQGFGQQGLDFWLGNRKLFVITSLREYVLRIEISFANGSHLFAEYDSFRILFGNYTLRVGRHRGNLSDILFLANNAAFSTWDRDNDKVPNRACARQQRGAWWYATTCDTLDLNSMLGNASSEGMVKITMKIKPKDVKRGNYI